jgi:hypothetical protein
MQRRNFFQALGGSAAALATTRGWAGTGSDNAQLAVPNFSNVPAVNPGDAEAYFTEEKLRQAIDTTPSLKGIKFEVVAYNFPSWHPSPFMEKIFGKGWTEFDTLKNSRPLYPGHLFPGIFQRSRAGMGGAGNRDGRQLRHRRLDDRLVLAQRDDVLPRAA